MNSFKYFITLFVFGTTLIANAQKGEPILAAVLKKYSEPSQYEYTTAYRLYKTHTSQNVEEYHSGLYQKKSKAELYFKLQDIEFFYKGNTYVQLNHDTKSIIISTSSDKVIEYDLSAITKDFTVASVKDNKTNWQLELHAKKNVSYPYSLIMLYVRKDYTIEREIFYYNTGIDFSQDYTRKDISRPRLEIVYSNILSLKKFKSFNLSDFFVEKNRKKYPTESYKEYRIVDNRKTNQQN
ncbi:LolA family protein [Flavobacterium sp. RHBU_24]|uniref:LolA family protein n=1 Tax=Flavobacterium sp. RHBU_24 TaxID=3391185 RepID=UPI003984D29C